MFAKRWMQVVSVAIVITGHATRGCGASLAETEYGPCA